MSLKGRQNGQETGVGAGVGVGAGADAGTGSRHMRMNCRPPFPRCWTLDALDGR